MYPPPVGISYGLDEACVGYEFIPSEATVYMANSRGIIMVWRDVALSLWSGLAQASDFDAVEAAIRQDDRKRAVAIGVTADAPFPKPETRKRIAEYEFSAENFLAHAILCRGTGLRASAIRSFMSGLRLMSRRPIASFVSDRGEGVLTWLGRETPQLDLPNELPEVMNGILDARARPSRRVPLSSSG